MNSEYYHKRLYNYLRLSGSVSLNTLTVYKSNLNLLLARFPEPEKADLIQLQEFALSFTNDKEFLNLRYEGTITAQAEKENQN